MKATLSLSEQLHFRAIEVSSRYKKAEAELVDVIQQLEENQVYLERGHASLSSYVVSELGLGENVTYTLITIARKARQVPELKTQLHAGALTLSNARRVAAILTPANQEEWIRKARELSNRQLEREIVRVKPEEAVVERVSYVTPDRVKLQLGLSEREIAKLRRVQDLLSQSQKRAVSLEQAIEALSSEFLRRHDPLEKAKRHEERSEKKSTQKVGELVTLRAHGRERISADLLHRVNLRDHRRCAQILPDGTRCNRTRWVEVHHKIPRCEGGPNSLENLVTLCSTHHRFWHRKNPPKVSKSV
jgi:5-methylcytosine-specific restriction endonuclease McrA